MIEPTCSQRDAASVLFNLSGYRVVEAVDTAAGRGINLRGSNHVVCVSNSMEDVARANIMMEASSYCTVEGNVIEGTASGVSPYSVGIDIKDRDNVGCSYNTIVGNTIKGVAYAGIAVSRTGAGVSSWNILNGNIVASQGRTPIGILLSGDAAQDDTITGNILSGETSDLHFNATSVRNLMGDNTLVHGVTTGTPDATNSTTFLRMHDKSLTSSTAVPTAGTWTAGDICLMRSPVNGGLVGRVCVTAGTPGVWRPFGHSQLSGRAAWDPPSLASGAAAWTTVAVAGALVTDIAEASGGQAGQSTCRSRGRCRRCRKSLVAQVRSQCAGLHPVQLALVGSWVCDGLGKRKFRGSAHCCLRAISSISAYSASLAT